MSPKYRKSVLVDTSRYDAETRRWRVFYTRPRAEKTARDRLDSDGMDVFLPIRLVTKQWTDRKKQVPEPLFTSYIFAQVNERERLHVLQTDGIVKAVAFGGRIAEVSEEEIASLKLLQKDPEALEAEAVQKLPEGMSVLVIKGPLKGIRGTVLGHPKPFQLIVHVPSISQVVRVNLPGDWVERIEE